MLKLVFPIERAFHINQFQMLLSHSDQDQSAFPSSWYLTRISAYWTGLAGHNA